MKKGPRSLTAVLLIAILALAEPAAASSLVLHRTFIERIKNRATVEIEFHVDHAKNKPNRIKDNGNDGDLHAAGRSKNVGLPMVVEIVNAGLNNEMKGVTKALQDGVGQPAIKLTGVWRVWFEHPPKNNGEQAQDFQDLQVPKDTNPDHMFEVHPITVVGQKSARGSFVEIPGFTAYDAQKAFGHYDSLKVTVQKNGNSVRMFSKKAVYNYVEFVMELKGKPFQIADGFHALGKVLDAEGHEASKRARRMVFAAGTQPAQIIAGKKEGDTLRVLGIPRVNLEQIAKLADNTNAHGIPHELPYEIVIVAVLEEDVS